MCVYDGIIESRVNWDRSFAGDSVESLVHVMNREREYLV